MNTKGKLQSEVDIEPGEAMMDEAAITKIRDVQEPVFKSYDDIHYTQMFYVVNNSLQETLLEIQGDDLTDHIDKKVEELIKSETQFKCTKCHLNGLGIYYQKTKRICDICKSSLKTEKTERKVVSNQNKDCVRLFKAKFDETTKKVFN